MQDSLFCIIIVQKLISCREDGGKKCILSLERVGANFIHEKGKGREQNIHVILTEICIVYQFYTGQVKLTGI